MIRCAATLELREYHVAVKTLVTTVVVMLNESGLGNPNPESQTIAQVGSPSVHPVVVACPKVIISSLIT